MISEFGGGLGDVITLIYHSDRYNRLEKLADGERAMIVLMCHNPHAKELFLWHPKVAQLDIRDVGFWWPHEDEKMRTQHKLPPAQPLILGRQEGARFYPSPEDLSLARTLDSFRYVVVSTAAGSPDRNLPDAMVDDAIARIIDRGYRVVVVGRRYHPERRRERVFSPRGGLIDMIDRLTVPGTFEVIARSAGVFCCHSVISLISWYLRKPVLLGYPRDVQERDFHSSHQYTFGKDYPTTVHFEFSTYVYHLVERFLKICDLGGRP